MDPTAFIQSTITQRAVTFDVLRSSNDGAYEEYTETGDTVEAVVFSPSGSTSFEVEGIEEETSMVGLMNPQYDTDDNLVEIIQVGDRLRPTSDTAKLYEVRAKRGHPNELDPSTWRLALSKANQ